MEIPKETQCKICDWLDAKSKKISAERDSTKKKIQANISDEYRCKNSFFVCFFFFSINLFFNWRLITL